MIEEVNAIAVGVLGKDGQIDTGFAFSEVKLNADEGSALAEVSAAIAIGIDKDQVANANGEAEAKIDGEIGSGVDVIIAIAIEPGFALTAGGSGAEEEGDDTGGDTEQSRISKVDAVLTNIIVTGNDLADHGGTM